MSAPLALFSGRFQGRAGESAPEIATLRMLAPRPDGLYVLVELNMPLELFTPGYHPFHSFESVGDLGVFHPMFGPFRFARIGDGAVQLDEASLQPGGLVSGRFDGIINYYVCVETVAQFFQPPPEPEIPMGEATEDCEVGASSDERSSCIGAYDARSKPRRGCSRATSRPRAPTRHAPGTAGGLFSPRGTACAGR